MSLQRHLNRVKSLTALGALGVALTALGALAASAAPPPKAVGAPKQVAAPTQSSGLDQNPIDAYVTKVNTANLPTEQAAASEESDMTVLVLEDRHLLALASRMSSPANPAGLAGDAPTRPATDRFQFAFDAHRLDPDAEAILRQHGQYLEANPGQKVQLSAHTDAQGAEPYNRFLSRLRATSAARILREEGAREDQIEVQAFGSDKPLAQGDHAANRRLELNYDDSRLAMGK